MSLDIITGGSFAPESRRSLQQFNDRARAQLARAMAAYVFDVSERAVGGPTRGEARVAFARQLAMYLAHVGCGLSLSRVAVAFDRDRSTVAHACKIIEDMRDDADFDAWINALEDMLKAAPAPLSGDKVRPW